MSDLLASWSRQEPNTRALDGAFLFADVTGFTALSEQLEDRGREGAELLSWVVTDVLTGFVASARRRGGDILSFGGDAILVHFGGRNSVRRAVVAANEMQLTLADPVLVAGLGAVTLSVSIGIHVGTATALRIETGSQTEAVVVGPTITRALEAEAQAGAGEILLTHAAARRVPGSWHRTSVPAGILAANIPLDDTESLPPPAPTAAAVPIRELLSPQVVRVAGTVEADGEHRRVAVGFVRVAGMDEVVAAQGREAAHQRVHEVVATLAAQCDRTGAHILTVDPYPDAVKILVCAGAPVATDDNEGALLEALRATVEALPGRALHLGANRGLAYAADLGAPTRRGYTLLGDTVNIAARLTERASPGELLATAAIVDRTDVARTRLAPFRVRGRSDLVAASRVERGDGERVTLDLPLIGRDTELARLDDLARQASRGRAVAVDIVAPAGHGKSRLARELVARHPELTPVLGRATPYGASTALVGRLGTGLCDAPMVVVVDDAQWLDEATRELLRRLVQDHPDRPWLVLALTRDRDAAVFAGLRGAHRLDLDVLEDTSAARLVRAAAGTASLHDRDIADVVAQARGNCLFLVEFASSRDDDVPDDVEALIARRLDALDPEARRLVGIAAVVGATVSLPLARSVSVIVDSIAPTAADWAAANPFLEPVGQGHLAWVDPVFREVAYAALPYRRRRSLHRAVHQAAAHPVHRRAPTDW